MNLNRSLLEMSKKPNELPLRRSKSLRSASVISKRNPSDPSLRPIQTRPKKKKRDTLRKRLSLAISSDKDKAKEEIAEPVSRKISIDENVSFSHKEHVGKEEANQFLLRLLKLREERYMEMHQQIRETITRGYMFLRPPKHMVNQFEAIVPKETTTSFRRRKKKKPTDTPKSVKFWFELIPQPVGPQEVQKEDTEISSPRKSKKNGRQRTSSVLSKRYEQIHYFPSNLENSAEKAKSDLPHSIKQLPKGAPDYILYAYSSEYKTDPSQVLAVIPLNDVNVTPISPTEFTISYVNRLPNAHCFRLPTPDLMQTWLKSIGLATQQEIHNPFHNSRPRGASLSHGITVLRNSITPRSRSKEDLSGTEKEESEDEIFYKPVCWNESDLRSEAGDAFSNKLQLQEVYQSDTQEVASFFEPVRQGWRVLGGTVSDLLAWCVLTSERSDKPNIDVTAFLLGTELQPDKILEILEEILSSLKQRLVPTAKKRRTGFFKSSQAISELLHSDELKEEHISNVVTFERRVFNFVFQFVGVLLQTHTLEEINVHIQSILDFTKSHCGIEKVKVIQGQIENITAPPLPRTVSLDCIESELVPPGESVFCVSSNILAEQLTVMESEYFNRLRMPEFLNLAWDKEPEKAPGINELIKHYNQMGLWVATEILMAATPRLQAKAIGKFLRIAQKLFELRNYATCAQILSGVSNRAVQRLKRVIKQLDWKTAERYEQLNDHFDPVSGYANYRNKLDHAAPSIPFLAVHLRTLTLIEEGNPKTLGDDPEVLSFARMVMYTECIASLHLGDPSMTDYGFQPIPEIQNHLHNKTIMDEEKLYDISIQFEPLRGGLAKSSNV